MAEAIQGNLPHFNVVQYTTKDGEHCSATKNNGVVTIVGDKNGTRQLPLNEFMQQLAKDLPKTDLEKTPEKDTVAFSGNENTAAGEEAVEKQSSGVSKGVIAGIAAAGLALIGAGVYLLTKGKVKGKVNETVENLAKKAADEIEKTEKVVKPAVEETQAKISETAQKLNESSKKAFENFKEKIDEIAGEVSEIAQKTKEKAEETAGKAADKINETVKKETPAAQKSKAPEAPKTDIPSAPKTEAKPKTKTSKKVKTETPKAEEPVKPVKVNEETAPAKKKAFEDSIKEQQEKTQAAKKKHAAEQLQNDLDNIVFGTTLAEDAGKSSSPVTKAIKDKADDIADTVAGAADDLFSAKTADKIGEEVISSGASKTTAFADDFMPEAKTNLFNETDDLINSFNKTEDDILHTDNLFNSSDDFLSHADDYSTHLDDVTDLGDGFDIF